MILNSTTTCADSGSGTICTTLYAADPSSTPATADGFTYGEIVISIFDFLILLSVMAVVFHLKFRKIKVKNI